VDNALGLMGADVGGYQRLMARLDLFSEAIVMTRYGNDGATSCFEVSAEALATAFSGVPVATGLLPRECLFYARDGNTERLAIFVPPEQWTLATADGEVYDVPLPPLIWSGCGRKYHIWAVKQRPGERERLFHAPFPNVYPDGRVCVGNVKFPACSASTIHQALELFLQSEFNEDLASGKSESYEDNVLILWDEIHDTVDFPLDELVKTHRVLDDVIKGRW